MAVQRGVWERDGVRITGKWWHEPDPTACPNVTGRFVIVIDDPDPVTGQERRMVAWSYNHGCSKPEWGEWKLVAHEFCHRDDNAVGATGKVEVVARMECGTESSIPLDEVVNSLSHLRWMNEAQRKLVLDTGEYTAGDYPHSIVIRNALVYRLLKAFKGTPYTISQLLDQQRRLQGLCIMIDNTKA